MRKTKALALVAAAAFAACSNVTIADTPLFVSQADFGGSGFAPGGTGYASGFNGGDTDSIGYYTPGTTPTAASIAAGQQTGWEGWGDYDGAGGIYNVDNNGDSLVYNNVALSGASATANGVGNYANDYASTAYPTTPIPPFNATGNDPNGGTGWAGAAGIAGSVTIQNLNAGQGETGQETQIQSGEMVRANSPASAAFLSALQNSYALAIDFTAPGPAALGGGTNLVSVNPTGGHYYLIDFGTFSTYLVGSTSTNGGFNTSQYDWVNTSSNVAAKDIGYYGDQPGSFAFANGTGASSYWTAYFPYGYPTGVNAATVAASLQMFITFNSLNYTNGNVTIDDIRTVSPTWAASGSGSWNLGATLALDNSTIDPGGTNINSEHEYETAQGNWIGAEDTYVDANGNTDTYGLGVPDGSGISVTFGDLETGNATVGLDTNQTVGMVNFNSPENHWQYNLAAADSGTGAGGTLIMDNTANTASAQINDIAGSAIEYITAPVQLNSNTVVTVATSGNTLFFGSDSTGTVGGISGVGGITIAGAGTVDFSFANAYSGGTTVTGGTLLIAASGALPAASNVTITGGALRLGTGTGLETLSALSISGGGLFDVNNNHITISYAPGTQATADALIRGYLVSGYAGGAWNGPGLDSSAANALFVSGNKHYGLGYADGADMNGSSPLVVGLGAGNIEVKYTLYGDANLDGVVNGTDFGILAAHFGDQVTAWDEGDFNYDGVVNGSDFGALAANFGQQANGTAVDLPAADYAALDAFAAANGLLADVPEPASAALLIVAGLGVLARRRRSVN